LQARKKITEKHEMLTQMCRHLRGNELETYIHFVNEKCFTFFIKVDEKRIVWNYKNKIYFIIKKLFLFIDINKT